MSSPVLDRVKMRVLRQNVHEDMMSSVKHSLLTFDGILAYTSDDESGERRRLQRGFVSPLTHPGRQLSGLAPVARSSSSFVCLQNRAMACFSYKSFFRLGSMKRTIPWCPTFSRCHITPCPMQAADSLQLGAGRQLHSNMRTSSRHT